jgi:hypothetical protein
MKRGWRDDKVFVISGCGQLIYKPIIKMLYAWYQFENAITATTLKGWSGRKIGFMARSRDLLNLLLQGNSYNSTAHCFDALSFFSSCLNHVMIPCRIVM